jgi:hypothetical protein
VELVLYVTAAVGQICRTIAARSPTATRFSVYVGTELNANATDDRPDDRLFDDHLFDDHLFEDAGPRVARTDSEDGRA